MSQNKMVLQHLQDFGSITTWDAFKDYGITRLSARVSDLRQKGYLISSEDEYSLNRYGKKVRYTRYRLDEQV